MRHAVHNDLQQESDLVESEKNIMKKYLQDTEANVLLSRVGDRALRTTQRTFRDTDTNSPLKRVETLTIPSAK